MVTSALNTTRLDARTSSLIRQTYQILGASLLFSALCAYAGVQYIPSFGLGLLIGLTIVEIGLIFAIGKMATRAPLLSLLFLFAFTGLSGLTLTPLLQQAILVDAGLIIQALVLASVAFVTLSFYAMRTNRDFSMLGGVLFVLLILMLVASLLNLFLGSSVLSLAISVFGVLLFSAYIIFDTQNLIRGGVDSPILAALSLFLNFLNLFVSILRILLQNRD